MKRDPNPTAYQVTVIPTVAGDSRIIMTNLDIGLSSTYVSTMASGDVVEKLRAALAAPPAPGQVNRQGLK